MIYAATRDKKPTIGIITGAEVFGSYQAVLSGGAPNPWVIIEQLGALYNIEQIYNPDGFEQTQPDFLLMIHPADLDPLCYMLWINILCVAAKPLFLLTRGLNPPQLDPPVEWCPFRANLISTS